MKKIYNIICGSIAALCIAMSIAVPIKNGINGGTSAGIATFLLIGGVVVLQG